MTRKMAKEKRLGEMEQFLRVILSMARRLVMATSSGLTAHLTEVSSKII
jgi:hypothetical protein